METYVEKIMTLWDIDWRGAFIDACQKICQQGRTELCYPEGGYTLDSYPDRGVIKFDSERKCKKCNSSGIYYGYNLETGHFYYCAKAQFCPSCGEITDDYQFMYFERHKQKLFLPVMKKKALRGHSDECVEQGECPDCGNITIMYMTAIYEDADCCYDNEWIICSNPMCSWPGKHVEHID